MLAARRDRGVGRVAIRGEPRRIRGTQLGPLSGKLWYDFNIRVDEVDWLLWSFVVGMLFLHFSDHGARRLDLFIVQL